MPPEDHSHFLNYLLLTYDSRSQTFLAFALKLKHRTETTHILRNAAHLLTQWKLQELNLLQLFHFDPVDTLKVRLQLFYLLFLSIHISRIISILEFQFSKFLLSHLKRLLRHSKLFLQLNHIKLLIFTDSFAIFFFQQLVVYVRLLYFPS